MTGPTWGDTIQIKQSASPDMRPGALAAVCGIRAVETVEQARQFDCAIGTILYLVEFGDGTSIEIPDIYLELAPDDVG